jgi:hypothetical protein
MTTFGDWNTNDVLSTSGGGQVPTGLIMPWSGTLETIPTGWAFCDGNGGRPDLRNSPVWYMRLFESDTVDSLPAGFTVQFGGGFAVKTVSSNNVVQQDTTTGRAALVWSGLGSTADIDIRANLMATNAARSMGIAVRASGTSGAENGYVWNLEGGGAYPKLYAISAGSASVIGTGAGSWTANNWYTLRMQCYGTSIRCKWWLSSSAEPTDWQVSVTDSSLATGYIGMWTNLASGVEKVYWDKFGPIAPWIVKS